uniref:Family with sequence similarity 180 member A n=1 Tax=Fundulus heteroclitus TaxID=8078 RepID=A0A3Q2R0K6_FUNHE
MELSQVDFSALLGCGVQLLVTVSVRHLNINVLKQMFLLFGLEINQDDNVVLLDEELASMRKGQDFLSRINDGIPKSLSSMQLMAQNMEKTPPTRDQFENLVLSMVYSALQARVQRSREEREAWGGVLLQLANVTTYKLRGALHPQWDPSGLWPSAAGSSADPSARPPTVTSPPAVCVGR